VAGKDDGVVLAATVGTKTNQSVTALKKPPPPSQPLAALDVTDVADGHRLSGSGIHNMELVVVS